MIVPMKSDGTFLTVAQVADRWGISGRRIRVLCAEGKIPGAEQIGRGWRIPLDAVKPSDTRLKSRQNLLSSIDEKKFKLDHLRPFTQGELERLNEQSEAHTATCLHPRPLHLLLLHRSCSCRLEEPEE